MAYYEDLTPYIYTEGLGSNYLNIGWLSRKHPFRQGAVSQSHQQTLKTFCAKPVNLCRGFHDCDLCPSTGKRWDYEQARQLGQLGNGEIHVPGLNGLIYVAPVLIFHYVIEHHYQPPQGFLTALEKAGDLENLSTG